MPEETKEAPAPTAFVPRTLVLMLVSAVLFALLSLAIVWPELRREPPTGAIVDYAKERAQQQLRGKVPALVGLSVGGAALLAYLGWLPGFRRPRP